MTLIVWIISGVVIGVLARAVAERRGGGPAPWIAAALVGAIVGGLIGNQMFGTTPISLSWDVLGVLQSVLNVVFGPINVATAAAVGIGSLVASGVAYYLTASPSSARARAY